MYPSETNELYEARRTVPDQNVADYCDADLLAVIQHYGAATRLLDWTENLLVALWMAACDDPFLGTFGAETDAALIVMAPWQLNEACSLVRYPSPSIHVETSPDVVLRAAVAFEKRWTGWHERVTSTRTRLSCEYDRTVIELADAVAAHVTVTRRRGELRERRAQVTPPGLLARFRSPVAFRCRFRTERIRLQRGMFTIHGGKRYPPGESALDEPGYLARADALPSPLPLPSNVLAQATIPRTARRHIHAELSAMGLSPATVAGGLQGNLTAARRRNS